MNDDKIKIKCKVLDSIDEYKFNIKIYDSYNTLIYCGNTDESGTMYFKPKYYGVYKVIITNKKNIYPRKLCSSILIYNNYCHTFLFSFYKCLKNKNNPITIILTDKNYKNLPIEKGEILLWPKNI
ncbi:MAG: hypothetical protein J6J17_05540 [Bacilli bacterium]|nr:hypothetical protein [Bacilli bacterium]